MNCSARRLHRFSRSRHTLNWSASTTLHSAPPPLDDVITFTFTGAPPPQADGVSCCSCGVILLHVMTMPPLRSAADVVAMDTLSWSMKSDDVMLVSRDVDAVALTFSSNVSDDVATRAMSLAVVVIALVSREVCDVILIIIRHCTTIDISLHF